MKPAELRTRIQRIAKDAFERGVLAGIEQAQAKVNERAMAHRCWQDADDLLKEWHAGERGVLAGIEQAQAKVNERAVLAIKDHTDYVGPS